LCTRAWVPHRAREAETEALITLSLGFPTDELLLINTNSAVLAGTAAASHQVSDVCSSHLSSPYPRLMASSSSPGLCCRLSAALAVSPQRRVSRVASTLQIMKAKNDIKFSCLSDSSGLKQITCDTFYFSMPSVAYLKRFNRIKE